MGWSLRLVLQCCLHGFITVPVQLQPGLPHWQLSPQLQLSPHLHSSTTQSSYGHQP